jgi:two-component system response regulator AtoC
MSRILVIDDDQALCRSLQIQLAAHDHQVQYAHRASDGLELVSAFVPDLVLLDLGLPDGSGLGVLPGIRERSTAPVAMITGRQDMKSTIEAMRHGAFDYLRKPFVLDDVLLLLEKARRAATSAQPGDAAVSAAIVSEESHEIIGSDPRIQELIKEIGLLSRSPVTVLIEGESGTGKELVARALHNAGAPGQPFVAINCSAVVATLLESELFGHERGAFTGADSRKLGKLELAGQGTLFLDEIGDMDVALQAKLLRVLQERTFERVGGVKSIPFRARVVAATHRDLRRMAAEGDFREDLLFRLAVSRLSVPPVRERRGDIRILVQHLLGRIARELHRPVRGAEESAIAKLQSYDWPGNVRELENVLTRAVALSRGTVLRADELELTLGARSEVKHEPGEVVPLQEAERRHVQQALVACAWNITQTARALQISPTTLRKKIADYGLHP